ncbi:MAG: TIGR01212 family radical SAM protein [Lachnospiraceae bacterium]|nr:TIGR01212 family radical SAM protein [Lachnospiraceae bacterium]
MGNLTNTIKYWGDKPYYSLNYYLKETFGEKVYRLSLNGGMTCPNRDGTIDTRGCIFCSAGGSGDFAASPLLSITAQIEQAKQRITAKSNAGKFIAYFQAYTNTYAPIEYLRSIYMEAVMHPDIVLLSIATRPDCLSNEILDLLSEINRYKPVWIELGLQTIHPQTSAWIRSGFTLSDFTNAVAHLHARNIPVIVHLILGLLGENRDMMLDSVAYVSSLPISGIKLQLLHILKGTDLDFIYQKNPFPLPDLEEYANLIADCIEILPEHIVIHRITGDGPKKLLTAPLWSADKKRVLNTMTKILKQRGTYQGKGGITWQSQIPYTKSQF